MKEATCVIDREREQEVSAVLEAERADRVRARGECLNDQMRLGDRTSVLALSTADSGDSVVKAAVAEVRKEVCY